MKVPKGNTIMPPEVKKAKEILEEIEKEERLGMINEDELSDFDDLDDDEKCMIALKGAKLLDDHNNIA